MIEISEITQAFSCITIKIKTMKKIKKFVFENCAISIQKDEMKLLTGGDTTFTCNTGGSCKLYINNLGIVVPGTCAYEITGGSVRCYCVNGNYTTSSSMLSSCWKE